jgi:hypothetical protein
LLPFEKFATASNASADATKSFLRQMQGMQLDEGDTWLLAPVTRGIIVHAFRLEYIEVLNCLNSASDQT